MQHTTLHYLIDEKIEAGLVLERQYDDYRFVTMRKRVEQQLLSLSELYTAYEMEAANEEDLLLQTNKLLTILDQIIRLHSITRDGKVAELHQK